MRLGVVSDLHFRERPGPPASWHGPYDFSGLDDRVKRALARFDDEGVDAVLALGDLTHEGDEASLAAAFTALSAAHQPVYVVAGNHDLDPTDDAFVRAAATAGIVILGASSTAVGAGALVGVRVRRDESADGSTVDPLKPASGHRSTRVPDSDALAASLTLVASHFPMLPHEPTLGERELGHPGDLEDRATVAAALVEAGGPVVVMCGHLHVRHTASDGRLLELLMPSVIERPMEATIVDLDVDALELTRTAVPLSDAREEGGPVFAPRTQTWRFGESRWRQRCSPGETSQGECALNDTEDASVQ